MNTTFISSFAFSVVAIPLASAVNIVSIDFDANPTSYTYGTDTYFGYGRPAPDGNQAESLWNVANRNAALSVTNPVNPAAGIGNGGTSGLRASYDSSGLTAAAEQDSLERFGDSTLEYTYWGGSFGVGSNPAAQISTTDLSQIVFSIDAAFAGVVSAGTGLRVDVSFNPDMMDVLQYRAEFAIPATGGFNTYSLSLDQMTRTLGTDDLIDDTYSNINFNVEVIQAQGRFGIDADNSLTIDNLSLEQVPEPSVFLLTGLAGLLAVGSRRR